MKKIIGLLILWMSCLMAFGEMVPRVVKIYSEEELDALLEAGVKIERRRGDILLCYVPVENGEGVVIPNGEDDNPSAKEPYHSRGVNGVNPDNNLRNVLKGKAKRDVRITLPTLDQAVGYFDAFSIQEGKGFDSPFTGKGVVAGFCDIGFDPMHPAFLDEDGKSRVKQITHYKEFEGKRTVLKGDSDYLEWKTDSLDMFHATHVAGILAGRGAATPYKGVAYDADIVASVCCLSDFGLLMGVEDIIDYAKEAGKPAVINLSMGNYIGAHDGTSLFSQYLDLCADDAIIVLSAGNEGHHTNTLTHKFANGKPLHFRIGNKAWDQKHMYGITDIWNTTSNSLKLTLCVFDDETHEVVYEYPPVRLEDWDEVRYEWNPEKPLLEGLTLDGYLIITGGIDPENGRYEVGLIYEYDSTRLIGSGWAKDMLSIKIEADDGEEIEAFADGTYTRLMPVSGYPGPGSLMSISDLACGFRTVSVGMYGNREEYPVSIFEDGKPTDQTELKTTGLTPLQTVTASSYGTLRDGRVMPLTVAPGNLLMSAINRYYLEAHPEETYYMAPDGSPWFCMGGTSMAAPFVAGYIATWLEAIPSLTVEDAREMIEAGNSHDIPEPQDPRNLNGFFNPVKSLRYALDKNGITQIKNPESLLQPDDYVEIYSLSGLKVYSGRADGSGGLLKGVYVVKTPYGVFKKALP